MKLESTPRWVWVAVAVMAIAAAEYLMRPENYSDLAIARAGAALLASGWPHRFFSSVHRFITEAWSLS